MSLRPSLAERIRNRSFENRESDGQVLVDGGDSPLEESPVDVPPIYAEIDSSQMADIDSSPLEEPPATPPARLRYELSDMAEADLTDYSAVDPPEAPKGEKQLHFDNMAFTKDEDDEGEEEERSSAEADQNAVQAEQNSHEMLMRFLDVRK